MRAAIFLLLAVFYLLLSSRSSEAVVRSHVVQRSILDAFEIFAMFPHLVAISDSNNDTIMECLTLERTHINRKSKTATYVFLFKGHHGTKKKNVSLHISSGDTPDKFEYYMDDDADRKDVGIILYTDHKNCYVVDGPYHNGEHCVLLVSMGVEDDVPSKCREAFSDICGVAVNVYSPDLCADDKKKE
ncbi:uncharacterized protein LOC144097420 [Amblyomma americanum]